MLIKVFYICVYVHMSPLVNTTIGDDPAIFMNEVSGSTPQGEGRDLPSHDRSLMDGHGLRWEEEGGGVEGM